VIFVPEKRSTSLARSESPSSCTKVASVISSDRGVDSARIKNGWILSVISGLLNVNIFDRIIPDDSLDTTE
jgi:hypothetical protein